MSWWTLLERTWKGGTKWTAETRGWARLEHRQLWTRFESEEHAIPTRRRWQEMRRDREVTEAICLWADLLDCYYPLLFPPVFVKEELKLSPLWQTRRRWNLANVSDETDLLLLSWRFEQKTFHQDLYSAANDPRRQMIPRPEMILKLNRKWSRWQMGMAWSLVSWIF